MIKSQDLIPCSVLPAKKLYRRSRSHYEHHTIDGLEMDFKIEIIDFFFVPRSSHVDQSLFTIIA